MICVRSCLIQRYIYFMFWSIFSTFKVYDTFFFCGGYGYPWNWLGMAILIEYHQNLNFEFVLQIFTRLI